MTTSRLQAPNGDYVLLNTGPCILEPQGQGAVRVIVSDSLPASGAAAFHLISYPAGQFVYGGSEKVYVQSDHADFDPYILVTPIV